MIGHSFEYDRSAQTLTATFENGSAYKFFDVASALYDEMAQSVSAIDFFNKRIWYSFEYASLHHTLKSLLRYIEENIVGFPRDVALTVSSRNFDDETPLHIACVWGDVSAVDLLIEAGAELDAKGDMGRTPLYTAESSGHLRCANRLLNAGASPVDFLY